MITPGQVAEAVAALDAGELVLFGADTVYGLACRPGNEDKLAAIKGRDPGKPNALMAFSVEAAGPLLGEAGAAATLLPGPVTLVLPSGAGLRVPAQSVDCAATRHTPRSQLSPKSRRASTAARYCRTLTLRWVLTELIDRTVPYTGRSGQGRSYRPRIHMYPAYEFGSRPSSAHLFISATIVASASCGDADHSRIFFPQSMRM